MIHDMIMAAAGASGPAAPSDADFENVTLLLHGDGTNGAQNNTFLDSSTNNFTITRNGNTTQGTFSPFSKPDGRWGNYFDGSGDNLTVANNAAFQLGSGDFTIEFWAYFNSVAVGLTPLSMWATNQYQFSFYTSATGVLSYYLSSNGTSWGVANGVSCGSVSANTWTHVALVRNGNTFTPYINGVAGTTTTSSATLHSSTAAVSVGSGSSVDYFNGYLSNVRIVKGTAVYTSAFTPPTSPLTAITNTSLLTCQSNRFKDNSSNNFTITRNGDVLVTPFSPFPTLTAYDAATNGGSGYFDGSGDFLSWPSGASVAFGTGDFTVEALIYATSSVSGKYVIDARDSGNTNTWAIGFGLVSGDSKLGFFDGSTTIEQASATVVLNSWQHCVVVRSGSTLSIYLNGTRVATATNTRNINVSPTTSYIGNRYTGSNYEFPGYLSSVRIVKGSAVYDPSQTTLTVPTAPLTAITNTSLLCNFTNAGIIDNSMSNNLETVGNAQIDTTTKKYGTGSMEFDGTGDNLLIPYSPSFDLGSGNFTIEFWINTAQTSATTILDKRLSATQSGWMVLFNFPSAGQISLYANGVGWPVMSSSSSLTLNQFVHVAIVRNGSSFAMYFNGTSVATATSSSAIADVAASLLVGRNVDAGSAFFNGFIDDLRITKGKARYTTTFTPPTAAFEDIGE